MLWKGKEQSLSFQSVGFQSRSSNSWSDPRKASNAAHGLSGAEAGKQRKKMKKNVDDVCLSFGKNAMGLTAFSSFTKCFNQTWNDGGV